MGAAALDAPLDEPLGADALGAAVVPLPVDDLLEELHADATNAATTIRTPIARTRGQIFETLTTSPSVS